MEFRLAFGFLLSAAALTPAYAQEYVISTYAGGAPPPTPASGLNLAIGLPQGIALDMAGNVYFTSLNCVFRLGQDGIVTRIAGTCRAGYSGDGGPATSAQFRLDSTDPTTPPYIGTDRRTLPPGVTVDNAGNVFVADYGNYRIRKISPDGIVTSVAGNGTFGDSGDGGLATGAQLSNVFGLAVDSAGNLFISDSDNHRVRLVTPDGLITTLAGNGTCGSSGDGGLAGSAQLCAPAGIATDRRGNLFVADTATTEFVKSPQTETSPQWPELDIAVFRRTARLQLRRDCAFQPAWRPTGPAVCSSRTPCLMPPPKSHGG